MTEFRGDRVAQSRSEGTVPRDWVDMAHNRVVPRRGGQAGQGAALRLDDLVADGVVDQFSQGMHAQLQHDVGAVGFGGVDAYTQ
jgi:hypothetical protein